MFQFLLDRSLSPNPLVARLFHRLQESVARRRDAVVRYSLNGVPLALPLSHDLPWNRRVHPTYSDNLRRLAAFVRERFGALRMIDVGANIGDSWALAGARPGDAFLLVEGSPRWFELLERNTAGDPSVTRVRALISDRGGEAEGAIVTDQGNAFVDRGAAGAPGTRTETLDEVIARHPAFATANLLKVDVEGYDPRVLRGGRRLLEAAGPVIFFEHHPRMLALAGENDRAVFGELDDLGYRRLVFYDNRGFLLDAVDAGDGARLAALVSYAAQQAGAYYDVCAFPDRHAAARDAFLAAERAWAARLGARPAPGAP